MAGLHGKPVGDTAFPSQKVHLFDSAQHHLDEGVPGRCENGQFWAYPDSRIAVLFCDGHSSLSKTGEANPG